MERPVPPDERLDALFASYLAERADEIGLTAGSGLQAAVFASAHTRATRSTNQLMVKAVLVAVLTLLLAISAILIAGPPKEFVTPPIPADHGVFTATGTMAEERELPSATLLRDGRVLVVGGYPVSGAPAELWDPATGQFSPAGTLAHPRWAHTATLLGDGRVLVVGGAGPNGVDDPPGGLRVAEIWDPGSMSFSALPSPSLSRFEGRAEVLPDGRVLISGGQDDVPAEVWDPVSGAFGPAASEPPTRPEGTLLRDGRVLVVSESGARLWDPVTRTTITAGSLIQTRAYDHGSSLLADGRVLLVGGNQSVQTAEIWDPTTLSSAPTGGTIEPRSKPTMVTLADGRVLVLGSNFRFSTYRIAEVFELRP